MSQDKPELTSHELIRQAREVFAVPFLDKSRGGTSAQELGLAPQSASTQHGASSDPSAWSYTSVSPSSELLSSELLLRRRSADLWSNDRSDSRDASEPLVAPTQAGLRGAPIPATPPMAPPMGPVRSQDRMAPVPPGSAQPLPPVFRPTQAQSVLQPPGSPASQAAKLRGLSWRWILAGVIGLVGIVGAVAGSKTTPLSQVELGDCFEDLGADQDCAGLHDAQAYAQLPAGLDDSSALANCDLELAKILGSDHMSDGSIVVPADGLIKQVNSATTGQDEAFCLLVSPSGSLFGSVLSE